MLYEKSVSFYNLAKKRFGERGVRKEVVCKIHEFRRQKNTQQANINSILSLVKDFFQNTWFNWRGI